MSKIQIQKCLKCNQNKEGLTFEVPIVDSQPTQFTIKHYCWNDLEILLKKELEEYCEDWERNKKKLFKECLSECQKHKTFDWPWRERSRGEYGEATNWNKINIICVQCNVNLFWDTTPYEDSQHICSYCSNCNQRIRSRKIGEHFSWNEENLPVYKCEKKDLVKPSKYWKQANCMNCDTALAQEEGKLLNWVSDYGNIYARTNCRPNTKGHCYVSSKRHFTSLQDITTQEWNDILPVLKDTVKKIDKVYKPLGYFFSIPVGILARQNYSHFYVRVVPKYKEGEGSSATGRGYKPATPEQIEATKKVFNPNSENVIAERSKVIARLHNETAFGYTVIATKQRLSMDKIENVDSETWSQIGEVLLELMRKSESKLDCHDFAITFRSGKDWVQILKREKTAIREKNLDTSQFDKYYKEDELKIILFPRFKQDHKWGGREGRPVDKKGVNVGSMENERIAEKLRDPEGYYEKWKGKRDYLKHKAERERERAKTDWKPWIWGGVATIGAFMLGIIGTVIWFKKKSRRLK